MTDSPEIVRVQLGDNTYDISIGTGLISDAGRLIASQHAMTMAVVITDENVRQLYALPVAESLAEAGIDVEILSVDPGEQSKSVETIASLWDEVLSVGADRKTCVIALGGGVVGDLAGFVAASFARGLTLIQIPTTLLAQVDSSVGGKVGINLVGAKNMVGHFWQPKYVLIDTGVLASLSDREYRAGLAEVIKYGVILDADFFSFLESNIAGLNARDPAVLRTVVARCCQLKADVVEADERETLGLRAVLNYGHTFAHALESVAGYGTLLHGEAVSIGMLCASRLAQSLGRVDERFTNRQKTLIQHVGLPTDVPDLDIHVLVKAMSRDKKVAHGHLRFVLPSKMGHVELVSNVDLNLARAALSPEHG